MASNSLPIIKTRDTFKFTVVFVWRDLFWKYNTQHFCLVVEQVQIKLTKFGQTNRQPKLADVRPTNKKTCRMGLTWYREAIPCQIYKVGRWGNDQWWRGDEGFKCITVRVWPNLVSFIWTCSTTKQRHWALYFQNGSLHMKTAVIQLLLKDTYPILSENVDVEWWNQHHQSVTK